MKLLPIIPLSVAALGWSTSAMAEESLSGITKGEEFVCATAESFSDAIDAAAAGDMRTFTYYLENGICLSLNPGIEYRVVDFNIFSPSRIRFFVDDKIVDVFGDYTNKKMWHR